MAPDSESKNDVTQELDAAAAKEPRSSQAPDVSKSVRPAPVELPIAQAPVVLGSPEATAVEARARKIELQSAVQRASPPPKPAPDGAEVLRSRLAELQRQFRAQTAQLQAELDNHASLRRRAQDLQAELETVEAQAAKHQREAAANAALAEELDETLRVAAKARGELSAALAGERREAARLEARLREIESELAARTAERNSRELELDGAKAQSLSDQGVARDLREELDRLQAARSKEQQETQERLGQALLEKSALAAENKELRKSADELRGEAARRQERIEGLLNQIEDSRGAAQRHFDDADLRLKEAEDEKASLEAAYQRSLAKLEEARREAEAREARLRELEESARSGQAESRRMMENAEAIQREGNEAMDAAQRLKTELYKQAEAEWSRLRAYAQKLERGEAPAGKEPILPEARPEILEPAAAKEQRSSQAPVVLQSPEADAPLRPEPAPAGRRLGLWLGLGLAALLAVLVWRPFPAPGQDHSMTFSHPRAMAWQGDVLWVADSSDQAVYRLRLRDGGLIEERRYDLAGLRVTGLALAGGFLYLADAGKNEVQRRRMDAGLSVEKSWPLPYQGVCALASDGRGLYAAYYGTGRISRHALDDSLSVQETYLAPASVVGMDVSGDEFWTADANSRRLIRHDKDSALAVSAVYGLPELEGGPLISAFAKRGGRLWLGREGSPLILERSRWLLPSRPAPDFSAARSLSQAALPYAFRRV
ncbi:MAG TPA: hypothetical protein DEB40_11000 [Elusimicrobia bacterium]|nr:hypothetical protein [Elusimicrobiota bacterium]HBT62258.1 hypothetical protein [Elusimicrobiota bacterium]